MKAKTLTITLCVLLILVCVFAACTPIVAPHTCTSVCPYCGKCTDADCNKSACEDKCQCEPLTVTDVYAGTDKAKLLAGTANETPCYRFVTNKEGPKIALVGGIHGDEVAGWTAATQLVEKIKDRAGLRGEILLIPKANIVADNLKNRYPNSPENKNGVSVYSGVRYSDLNRSFPLERADTATETTIRISTAILNAVEEFDPDYVVDMHESLHSYTDPTATTTLGDTLIFSNCGLFMDDLLYWYNTHYKPDDEVMFKSNPAVQRGSFNYYFTNTRPDDVVFTIETNRRGDTQPEVRVRQQLDILNALFDMAWDMAELD